MTAKNKKHKKSGVKYKKSRAPKNVKLATRADFEREYADIIAWSAREYERITRELAELHKPKKHDFVLCR